MSENIVSTRWTKDSDGDITFQLHSKDCNFGFIICGEDKESGWWFVTKKDENLDIIEDGIFDNETLLEIKKILETKNLDKNKKI